jgi:Uncharacterized conserved protein
MPRFLSLVILLSVSLSLPCSAYEVEIPTSAPSIKTRGDAQINVNPDLFYVVVGVETLEKDLNKAYALNDQAGTAVLAVAKKHKVKPEDVSTSQITVHPDYEGGGGSYRNSHTAKQIDHFHVSRTMSFRFRDSAMLEPILKDSVAAGANQIERVSFETSELRKHKDAARILALKAAREKAELLAKESGVNVGKVLRIDETQYSYDYPNTNNNVQIGVNQQAIESGGGIAIGLIPVKASIVATFELTQ